MNIFLYRLSVFVLFFVSCNILGQQAPQFTQYMYNTIAVNPAYAGSRGNTTITALGRTQWVGFDGAPDTQTLSFETKFPYTKVGLGLNLINDKIGPASETYVDLSLSYTIKTNSYSSLAFGLKLGGRVLNVDWTKGYARNDYDQLFSNNIKNQFLPTTGAGAYYYTQKWYAGFSAPNFLKTKYYDTAVQKDGKVGVDKMNFYLIGGYVFDINNDVRFKPTIFSKMVKGVPISTDLSGNFLFNNKFRAGVAWRWGDAFSALLGVQATNSLHLGYAYDLTTSKYRLQNKGTHEIFLRYDALGSTSRQRCSRFF